MPKKGANINLKGYDDLFSTEESRAEAQQERVQEIPLSELHPFEGHPFRVVDDEEMAKTVESVKEYGVLTPAIVRPDPYGGYEIISGHRRHHASELAGKDTMPVIVRDLDDDAAIIDQALRQKPKNFEELVQLLAEMGYEFQDGKHKAFKGKEQKRFLRLRSLGEGYSNVAATMNLDYAFKRVEDGMPTLYIYSADLKCLLTTHDVTWSRRDSFCEGQYKKFQEPEEFPTAPVRTQILQLPKRPGGLSFAKFDFDEEEPL